MCAQTTLASPNQSSIVQLQSSYVPVVNFQTLCEVTVSLVSLYSGVKEHEREFVILANHESATLPLSMDAGNVLISATDLEGAVCVPIINRG